ncbi:hypothetical protein SKAU_G00236370 [Synaphobranchus kaupii]|uniref:Uncharacterized protein n=1 Tax=Synaphobranchus kaupii TaxID=118154 RepID=A0A9Q1F725_SYNKA|nr:hypothetical protein SKAU_G00236370 [Synaphobranchus kaupii]
MGEKTRTGDVLPKTEVHKGLKRRADNRTSTKKVDEDTILSLLEAKKKNQSRPEEKLRSLNICPTLRTEVNSSAAEQVNRDLSSMRYSLCQMTEAHFKLTTRVMIELHNLHLNESFMKKMEQSTSLPVSLGQFGTLEVTYFGQWHPQQAPATAPAPAPAPAPVPVPAPVPEKLQKLLMGSRDERQILSRVGTRFPLTLKDVRSVCLLDLLEDSSLQMPWLTDDTVSLGHFEYVLWHREWSKDGNVDNRSLQRVQVFDFQRKEIRVYDSLKMKPTITPGEMLLLSNAFRDRGGLEGWAVKYPEQWRQKDDVNCGVFVCTAAENEVQNIEARSEDLSLSQCKELRKYHAANMIKELEVMDFPPTKNEVDVQQEKETKLQNEDKRRYSSNYHCMAAKMKTCLFQRATASKRQYHDHVQNYDWLCCNDCGEWIHIDCAGQKKMDWSSKNFSCGCTKSQLDLKLAQESFRAQQVDAILTDREIQALDKDLKKGDILSNRLYLHSNPGFDSVVKMLYSDSLSVFDDAKNLNSDLLHGRKLSHRIHLQGSRGRPSYQKIISSNVRFWTIFGENEMDEFLTIITEKANIDRKDLDMVDYTLNVLYPEACILILQKWEGFSRYQAEPYLGGVPLCLERRDCEGSL